MRICFVPIDNRPVCYNLVRDLCAIDESIEIYVPPKSLMGSLTKYAERESIFEWLTGMLSVDVMILSLDTLAYGGLIPSRRINESFDDIKQRIEKIKPILYGKKVLAFSSIMRISNNNCNEEEKEYWKDYGSKIFEYSYNSSKGISVDTDVPKEILDDYITTRRRNFEINKLYLEWQKEGIFDTLIFSKDDCAEFGFNVDEAKELEKLGGKTKTGADEIPLTLLARAIKKDIKIYIKYTEPDCKGNISNYEDVSIEKSVQGQLELAGCIQAETEKEADIILVVNNFRGKQGEHVMGWKTEPYSGNFILPKKPCAVADVRYANGADNDFIKEILKQDNFPEYGYSAWNTSANTIGSLLAGIKIKYHAQKYNENSWKKLQAIRLLDDWAYQANVRQIIEQPCKISDSMKSYEDIISNVLQYNFTANYNYPWNRKFEIEVLV